jgi:uncharacterized protein (TIGR02145 family)
MSELLEKRKKDNRFINLCKLVIMNNKIIKIWMYPLLAIGFVLVLTSNKNNDDNNNPVTDVDGNIYTTVTIGTQVWMVENLKVTKYRNGDPIPNVTDNNSWNELTTDAYCNYDNNATNVSTYGRLYNWYAVNDNRKIAPTGWHVPSDEEWATLGAYLGGNNVAGGKMKEPGATHWISPNPVADSSCGFKGLPGGIRTSYEKIIGEFLYIGQIGAYWSSTNRSESEAWMRFVTNYDKVLSKGELPTRKIFGYSVRCIKD